MSVYRRISEVDRPAWSDVTSIGTFVMEPEADWKGHYDERGERFLIGRFDPHYHDGDEYWLIRSGQGVVRIEEERFDFGPGDIICFRGGQVHDVVGLKGPVEGFWFECAVPPGTPTGHQHRTEADRVGHVIPRLPAAGGGI